MFKNRFLIILGVLSLLSVAMVISFPLSNTPTSAERGRAADAARWTAMGEYYEQLNGAQDIERSRAADSARWMAMGEYYQNRAEAENLTRSRTADAARWEALGRYYQQSELMQAMKWVKSSDTLYRSQFGECLDVSIQELATCRETSNAPGQIYRQPLDECFDVPLSELAQCRAESETSSK